MNAMQKKALAAAVSLALGAATLAPAPAAAGWYLGGGAGNTQFDEQIIEDGHLASQISALPATSTFWSTDASDAAYKLFTGWQFNDYVAVEAQYADFGALRGQVNGSYDGGEGYSASDKVDIKGYGANVVGMLPFLEHFAAMAKIGVFRWQSEENADNFVTAQGDVCSANPEACHYNHRKTDINYGAGVKWHITDVFAVQLEWENYKISDNDLQLFSGSVSWGF